MAHGLGASLHSDEPAAAIRLFVLHGRDWNNCGARAQVSCRGGRCSGFGGRLFSGSDGLPVLRSGAGHGAGRNEGEEKQAETDACCFGRLGSLHGDVVSRFVFTYMLYSGDRSRPSRTSCAESRRSCPQSAGTDRQFLLSGSQQVMLAAGEQRMRRLSSRPEEGELRATRSGLIAPRAFRKLIGKTDCDGGKPHTAYATELLVIR